MQKNNRGLQVPDHTYLQEMMGGSLSVRVNAIVIKALPLDVTPDDLYGYMPQANFIFARNGSFWPATSVDYRIKPIALKDADGEPIRDAKNNIKYVKASAWIAKHRPVETMTWAPGKPQLISNTIADEGGLRADRGMRCFNLYRAPDIEDGDASKAERWVEHVHKLFGDDSTHMIKWFAHRVQKPQDKINHAQVLIGHPGVGKDTLLEPVKYAIGRSNFGEVSPRQMQGDFTGFLRW